MNYLRNHCWCSDSNWGGGYDCQIIVSLSEGELGYTEDWNNLVTTKDYFNDNSYNFYRRLSPEESEEVLVGYSTVEINTLKPEVIEWLEINVKDFRGVKGWCIGSDSYVENDSYGSYDIFFQRHKDAMKFIKTWSVWKKPINYCQYFTDVRKKLNLETLKYEAI